ncbi:unnamed protein product, partial [marine sediment metagenome]
MEEGKKLVLGELLTIRTVPGREGKPIGRLPDGRDVWLNANVALMGKKTISRASIINFLNSMVDEGILN